MVFASQIFIFAFLPIFLAVYYTVSNYLRSLIILLFSYIFYGWWRIDYLAVVICISLTSHYSAKFAIAAPTDRQKKLSVKVGVSLILLTLAYFKYTHFIIGATNNVLETFGQNIIILDKIILPLGISFLSFQAISYIIDVARKDTLPAKNLIDFLAFVSLFPQLIAGPVLRYKDVGEQFNSRIHSDSKFSEGIKRFIIGLSMKIIIADSVAPIVDRIFSLDQPTFLEAWLGVIGYAIQLLFDFAGYSSMAVGLGLMIGFRFTENFNRPYISFSITEFWRRWHISLSRWLKDYLYIPLGGNRNGTLKTYRNLFLTMVLGGFWHGANWTFLLWGAWHGFFLMVERFFGIGSPQNKITGAISWVYTMLVVLLGWVFFRSADVGQAYRTYKGMVGFANFSLSSEIYYSTQLVELFALVMGVLISVSGKQISQVFQSDFKRTWSTVTILFVGSVLLLNARSQSPFLYFQF